MDTGFIVSNGMAFSPDGETMIFGDSRGDIMWRYTLDMDSGEIRSREPFLEIRNLPWRIDGATFDADGYYWCALVGYGAIGRFDPKGRLERLVQVPVMHRTMCSFGGPDLDVLYVATGTVLLQASALEGTARGFPLRGALAGCARDARAAVRGLIGPRRATPASSEVRRRWRRPQTDRSMLRKGK